MTSDERILILGLLSHYRLSLLKQLQSPASGLTKDGEANYRRDIAIAESAEAAIKESAIETLRN